MNPHAELIARRIAAELLTDCLGKGCRLAVMHPDGHGERMGGGRSEGPIIDIIAEKLSESFDAADQMALGIEQYAALQRYQAALLKAAAKDGQA